jgi:DNA-binding transcriptional MocR family regulator
VAFVPGAPFYAAYADAATLRLSFATADVGKILEGGGEVGMGNIKNKINNANYMKFIDQT